MVQALLAHAREQLGATQLSQATTFVSALVILLWEGTEAILVVAAMLLYVGYWLHSKSHSAALQTFIREKVGGARSTGTVSTLALISFLAVYREAFETVLFLPGTVCASRSQRPERHAWRPHPCGIPVGCRGMGDPARQCQVANWLVLFQLRYLAPDPRGHVYRPRYRSPAGGGQDRGRHSTVYHDPHAGHFPDYANTHCAGGCGYLERTGSVVGHACGKTGCG